MLLLFQKYSFLLILLPILVFGTKKRPKNRDKVVDDKLDPFKEEFFFRRQILLLLVPQMRQFGYPYFMPTYSGIRYPGTFSYGQSSNGLNAYSPQFSNSNDILDTNYNTISQQYQEQSGFNDVRQDRPFIQHSIHHSDAWQ